MRTLFKIIIFVALIFAGVRIYREYKDDILAGAAPHIDKLTSLIPFELDMGADPDSDRDSAPAAAPEFLASLPPLGDKEVRVHFIDAGQADAILIQSGAASVLIDGGEYKTRNRLIGYLRGVGVRSLDYVVATHPHSDHIGGLAPVIRQFDVKNVLMPDVTNNTASFEHLLTAIEKKGLSVTVPSIGDKITVGVMEFTVLAPDKEFEDINNASIVLRMAYGNTSFIFTGDAEIPSEKRMLKSGANIRADVLKAGHHGSRTATSEEFLDAVRPSIVVVMCGKGNSYKHPHKQFLDIVNKKDRKIELLRTDESGAIILITDGKKIKTIKERD